MSGSRVCVIDIPGLSRPLLEHVPHNSALGRFLSTRAVANLRPTRPAVTCSIQATLTTGRRPRDHGIIANGLPTFGSAIDQSRVDADAFAPYRKTISFWEQSNQFLDVPRFWQEPNGSSKWRTALICMQHSMPGFIPPLRPAADIVLTPKPDHRPDGTMSLCWSEPADLVPRLFSQFGPFPLMNYWGPMAGIASSIWIAKASAFVWQQLQPQLQWSYIPHLDYDLQRFGPDSPQAIAAVKDMSSAVEPLVDAVLKDSAGSRLIVLSEYAIHPVDTFIQPNRLLAKGGMLKTRKTPDGNLIDTEASDAFAMVDHQVAHVYCKGPEAADEASDLLGAGHRLEVLRPDAAGLDHRRSGDLILLAPKDAWFDYRWWNDPADAPTFANQIDIHRKPGYDPLELFWDKPPKTISQDPSKVRGSHGRSDNAEAIIAADRMPSNEIDATGVRDIIEDALSQG